jgi:hypothetical protein
VTVGQDAPTVAGCRHADETSAEVSMSLGSQDAGLARTIIGPGSAAARNPACWIFLLIRPNSTSTAVGCCRSFHTSGSPRTYRRPSKSQIYCYASATRAVSVPSSEHPASGTASGTAYSFFGRPAECPQGIAIGSCRSETLWFVPVHIPVIPLPSRYGSAAGARRLLSYRRSR